jgi:hypothetical protein
MEIAVCSGIWRANAYASLYGPKCDALLQAYIIAVPQAHKTPAREVESAFHKIKMLSSVKGRETVQLSYTGLRCR